MIPTLKPDGSHSDLSPNCDDEYLFTLVTSFLFPATGNMGSVVCVLATCDRYAQVHGDQAKWFTM